MTVLKRLYLSNFRNFKKASFTFSSEQNWITGHNGAGKTSLLEAISLLSTGKSHRTQNLQEAVHYGESHFTIEGIFSTYGIEEKLQITFGPSVKEIWHNETRLPGFLSLLGLLPSVFYAPSDIALIERSPKERRRFLNIHLAQLDPSYLHNLGKYTKALAQRNALLRTKKSETLSLWETILSETTKQILEKRKSLLEQITALLEKEYTHLQKREEIPHIIYEPSPPTDPLPSLWEKMRSRELLLGYTLLGSHRDDFTLLLNEKPAKMYASEGQKRSIIAAVKIAEASLFKSPLFLVDDFGVHLDPTRQQLLYARIQNLGQLFITSPEVSINTEQTSLQALSL